MGLRPDSDDATLLRGVQVFLAPSPENEGWLERTVSTNTLDPNSVSPTEQPEQVDAAQPDQTVGNSTNSQQELFTKLKIPMLECLLLQQDPGRKLPKRKHELVSMCLTSQVMPDLHPSEWEEV